MGGRRKGIKNGEPHKTGTWVKIFKMTIHEVKACDRVNVKRFDILVN